MRANILIRVSGAQRVLALIMEGQEFRGGFRFRNGYFEREFRNFPIEIDRKLDIGLLVGGLPRRECELTVKVKRGNVEKEKSDTEDFGSRGWAIFKMEVEL